jgi:hypothetical protein
VIDARSATFGGILALFGCAEEVVEMPAEDKS